MDKLYLHVVIVKKPIDLEDAEEMASSIIKDKNKTFYRETEDSYRFRNIPKTRFKLDSFVSKFINEKLTLIFGHLKD
jgi:Tfp pilus assembly ATPase PilU